MKFTSKNILSALVFTCISSSASAMSLGDGQITSRVGEPFSANIALIGAYDKDIKFYHVKGSECRSSLIGSTAAACDSVYEGSLTFFIKKKPDGQYFLRVNGERSEDFFYRLIIKYKSPSSGSVYKSFDFLPEFKNGNDTPHAASGDDDVTINTSLPSGKYGVLMGNIVEVPNDDEDKPAIPEPAKVAPDKTATPDKNEKPLTEAVTADAKKTVGDTRKHASDTPTKPAPKAQRQKVKAAAQELQIKKEGSYADDIFVLQKENEAIAQQIALLEKQIALLKEVDRLKAQASGASSAPPVILEMAPAISAPASSPVAAPAPAHVPAKITVQTAKQPDDGGTSLLSWVLIAVILLLAALLWVLYSRQKSLLRKYSLAEFKSTMVSPPSAEDDKYFDLMNEFTKK